MNHAAGPRLLVLSQLFPSDAQPVAGVFIRERMFRVARHLPIVVVAPQPWFPLQGLIRLFRPHFRLPARRHELVQGIEVHRPRFLSIPGIFKRADGWLLAVCTFPTIRRLVRKHQLNVLDVHFGYPDGHAGALLARWLRLPFVLTLRGKEERQARTSLASRLREAISGADRVVCVSEALKRLAVALGARQGAVSIIGNGIDLEKFSPMARAESRARLGLPADAKVIVSVGTLVERKGFHRVIEVLPALLREHAALHYLIVGGAGPEGDISQRLRRQVAALGLEQRVHFVGSCTPEELRIPLSASDLFVLATGYEGWANVFLEAMACGLPVITTRVGGNEQVVSSAELGQLVDLGDARQLAEAISDALRRNWDRGRIIDYARANTWDRRIAALLPIYRQALEGHAVAGGERRTNDAAVSRG